MIAKFLLLIYNTVSSILVILILPYIFISKKRVLWFWRLGFIKKNFKKNIWWHSASVGEVNAVKNLIVRLNRDHPNHDLYLTTMTETGLKTAEKISTKIKCSLLPIDNYFLINNFYRRICPELIIITETEFWPNMLLLAKKKKIPVIFVNARISDKSYPFYFRTKFFWSMLWSESGCVLAQSKLDCIRFKKLGFNRVLTTGNLKFSISLPEIDEDAVKKRFFVKDDDFILVLGSSRPGEEKLLVDILSDLRKTIQNLKVIIAPRHLERTKEVLNLTKSYGFDLLSNIESFEKNIIIDSYGVLTTAYAIADIAIIGGSFFDFGGHNPLEAVFYKKPVIMGIHHYSCRDTVEKLKEKNGIIISSNNQLSKNIIKLYENADYRNVVGINANQTLNENRKSLDSTLSVISEYINHQ